MAIGIRLFATVTGMFVVLMANCTIKENKTSVQEEIQRTFEDKAIFENVLVFSIPITCQQLLPKFYKNRDFLPIWEDPEKVKQMLQLFSSANLYGLNQDDYHLKELVYFKQKVQQGELIQAEFDVLLTDASLLFMIHTIYGKVLQTGLRELDKNKLKDELIFSIFNRLLIGQNIKEEFNQLAPKWKNYKLIQEKLWQYQLINLKGGWPSISIGDDIRPGDNDERINNIRLRLSMSGYLSSSYLNSDSLIYDKPLQHAILLFKKLNGILDTTTVIDSETQHTLNISVSERIIQLKVNLERYRWMSTNMSNEYILINIPDFSLQLFRNDSLKLAMKVAVGKSYRETPVFTSSMTYLVLNPYWVIPPTIFAKDVLPAIQANTNYLEKNKFKIVEISDKQNIVSPDSIDWQYITPLNFKYVIRQDPGNHNALGQVKFIFPNRFNVYMHDTNHREIFSQSNLAVSSGCIRLSKPLDLATYLLENNAGNWNRNKIIDAINTGETMTVKLQRFMDVHIQYLTVFADKEGNINFRKDIYQRDRILFDEIMAIPANNLL